MRRLHSFPGGIHPPEHKEQSTRLPIAAAPLPPKLVVPMQQHAGAAARPLVAPGERVLKGQVIGAPEPGVSAPVHAPTSGIVVALELQPAPHPSGLMALCAVIEPDGEERWGGRAALDPFHAPGDELLRRLHEAGIVGLGGAVFPSAIKARVNGRRIATLVVNGGECEPYISCDDMLMRERAPEIVRGIEILYRLTGAAEVVVGIEDNKPEALAAMRAAARGSRAPVEVAGVPALYPAGGERQLIKVVTGQEVPSGGLPLDIGVVCFNVATAYCVQRAVELGEPLVSRVITVTGNVHAPRNYECLLGTPVADLAELAGPGADTDGYIMGGPLMGFRLPSPRVPVVKASNCIIATSPALFPPPPPAMPCIRCGRCAEVCPARLQPMDLYWFAKARNFERAEEFSLFDCIECGCCDFVCPSHIPLVEYYKFAKGEIRTLKRERQAADTARDRHEFRLFRQEREKQERAARLATRSPKAAHAEGAPRATAETASGGEE
ncbi:MAG TPA: electron transport complex subunit RsxC [Burkholderiales bacterium]|nr:electron transport complex subunit RsxC [Burkholderiales bacterium]